MLPQPPDTLRAIRPFIHRGNQMASRDPIITYYCYFYAVRYALSKGLHTVSPESTSYVSSVMEELESRKEALRGDDRIDDDMVARAYVENFAGRIFDNGSRAVTAGTATEKTPDTLQAAATFLEITKIWEEQEGGDGGEEDGELAKKIRYAKWHAARILKAIKEGADINPPPPPVDQESRPPPATVEEVPDEGEPPQNEYFPSAPPPPAAAAAPSVPEIHEPSPPTLAPSSMGAANTAFPDLAFEHTHLPPPPSSPPAAATFHPQPSAPPPAAAAAFQPPPQQPSFPSPPQPSAYHSPPATSFHSPPPPPPQQHYPPPQQQHQHYQPIEVSEENIGKAQKSAKWAISALDYDDVETAVKQLKQALALLGASQ